MMADTAMMTTNNLPSAVEGQCNGAVIAQQNNQIKDKICDENDAEKAREKLQNKMGTNDNNTNDSNLSDKTNDIQRSAEEDQNFASKLHSQENAHMNAQKLGNGVATVENSSMHAYPSLLLTPDTLQSDNEDSQQRLQSTPVQPVLVSLKFRQVYKLINCLNRRCRVIFVSL